MQINFGKVWAWAAALAFIPALAGAQVVKTTDGSGTVAFALLAGQNIEAGTVTAKIDSGKLAITYTATNGWTIAETHLWVGTSLVDMPQTKSGNPQPGQFPYKANYTGATTATVTIPLNDAAINFACPHADATYLISAHAALQKKNADGTVQSETGWSAGSRITTRGNWATFSTVTLTCPQVATAQALGVPSCETAFARDASHNYDFLNYGFQRWGWSNGPYSPGHYDLDFWAGAGQSDVTKGYLAGRVSIDIANSIAKVTYTMSRGWWLTETQLYVGSTMFPMVTQGKGVEASVAPGQYGNLHNSLADATTDTFTVVASGPVYVIAHGVACHSVN